jgi:hypothetical protein
MVSVTGAQSQRRDHNVIGYSTDDYPASPIRACRGAVGGASLPGIDSPASGSFFSHL